MPFYVIHVLCVDILMFDECTDCKHLFMSFMFYMWTFSYLLNVLIVNIFWRSLQIRPCLLQVSRKRVLGFFGHKLLWDFHKIFHQQCHSIFKQYLEFNKYIFQRCYEILNCIFKGSMIIMIVFGRDADCFVSETHQTRVRCAMHICWSQCW